MTSTSSTYPRNTANSGKRGPASRDLFGTARSRIPSALLPDQGLRTTTQSPQSPTSSILHKRASSDSRKPSVDASVNGQRRTERSHVSIRETVTIRTKSPVKDVVDGYAPVRKAREESRPSTGGTRSGNVASQRKDRETVQG